MRFQLLLILNIIFFGNISSVYAGLPLPKPKSAPVKLPAMGLKSAGMKASGVPLSGNAGSFKTGLLPGAVKSQPAQNPPVKDVSEDKYAPIIHLSLEDPKKEIFILQPFYVTLSIIFKPGVVVTLPSKIDAGKRFQVEGEPVKIQEEKLDSGNIRKIYRIKLTSFVTDRLLDRKSERINKRMRRHEADLSEIKTKLTKAKLDGKDTGSLEKLEAEFQAKYDTDKKEFQAIQKQYEIKPIPVSYKRPDGTMGVVMSHEPGKGPHVLISSKLANDPDPKLKEPASEENKKAGGPFWEPFEIYEENTTLKNIALGILIGLGIFALLLPLILYIIKRRKRPAPPPPPKPAHIIAFTRIEELKSRFENTEDPDMKDFAFELSEIAREYFGNRYKFYSLEMTTYELLEKLNEISPQGIVHAELEEFFDFLDFVKFAKVPFSREEFIEYTERLTEFVRKTAVFAKAKEEDEQSSGDETAGGDAGNPEKKKVKQEKNTEQDEFTLENLHEKLIEKSVSKTSATEHEEKDKTENNNETEDND